jgi:serine/threonine-protein kinase SRPK3
MIGSKDLDVFDKLLDVVETDPSPRKTSGDYTIHHSRKLNLDSVLQKLGDLQSSDYGEARKSGVNTGLIQPDLFRAPEVLLGLPWTSKADIWNFAVMVGIAITVPYQSKRTPNKVNTGLKSVRRSLSF